MMKITYLVEHPGEYAAGIRGFSDIITITVDSGLPGGDQGEFAAFMLDALRDWYDGASVKLAPNS